MDRFKVGTRDEAEDVVSVPTPPEPDRRISWIEVGYVLAVIALASGLAETGVQYGSVFGSRKTGMGVEVFYDDLMGILWNGRGNAWVNADGCGQRLFPVWWAFLFFAAVGAILVKTPLLLAPVWFGGRLVARRTDRFPLGLAHLAAIVAGAMIGVGVFALYHSAKAGHLIPRFWGLHYLPGFGGCLAGEACGVLILTGIGRRRGLSSWLIEIALIDLIILGTAWSVRLR